MAPEAIFMCFLLIHNNTINYKFKPDGVTISSKTHRKLIFSTSAHSGIFAKVSFYPYKFCFGLRNNGAGSLAFINCRSRKFRGSKLLLEDASLKSQLHGIQAPLKWIKRKIQSTSSSATAYFTPEGLQPNSSSISGSAWWWRWWWGEPRSKCSLGPVAGVCGCCFFSSNVLCWPVSLYSSF